MVNYLINSIPLLRFEVHIVMLVSLITKLRFGGGVTCTWSLVRKHLTGGFLCAVLDLSRILCSLLILEYSGT